MAKKTINKELTGAQDLYNFLFEACNIIRGPVSQDNFKDYITPLLYYKRISDVYDEETEEALISSGGDKEYASLPEQHRFVIPDGCHWQEVRERTENLGVGYDFVHFLPKGFGKALFIYFIIFHISLFTISMKSSFPFQEICRALSKLLFIALGEIRR